MPPRCRAGVRDAATVCPTTPRARRARGRLHRRRGSGGRGADGRGCRGPPRARESHGAAGDSSAGMASRAGLRQPSSACGRSRAGLRQPGSALLALASAPSAAASRLPTAAPLGHSATPVCLRRRARPACSGRLPPAPRSASPLRRPRPVAAPTFCALRPAARTPRRNARSGRGGGALRRLPRRVGWWGKPTSFSPIKWPSHGCDGHALHVLLWLVVLLALLSSRSGYDVRTFSSVS